MKKFRKGISALPHYFRLNPPKGLNQCYSLVWPAVGKGISWKTHLWGFGVLVGAGAAEVGKTVKNIAVAAYEVIRDNVWEPIVRAGKIAFMILMTIIGVALVMALIVWVAKVHSYCRRGQAQSSVKKSESDHKRKSPADHRRWVSKRKQKEEPEPKPLV